jgi:hypothetical protein
MNALLNINSTHLKTLYSSFPLSKHKDKSNLLNMMLEPLQAMIQLAIMGVVPIGSKLTIHENILSIQSPNFIQPIARWINSDKKDDMYFLYQVIKRYIKWYHPENNNKSPITIELYNMISKMAIVGLNNLIKTYSASDSPTLIQVICMYKDILESNKYNKDDENNIDEVFVGIISLYDPLIIQVLYNMLQIIEKEDDETTLNNYIAGLNLIMSKKNKMIQEWIRVNLVF